MPAQKSILIIDDEAQLRRSLSLILKCNNYKVASAESARDGLQMLEREKYDLVFLDVKLPDGNGIHLLPSIRQLQPKIPVIILTAHVEQAATSEAERLGACAYLIKPIDPEEILTLVAKNLGINCGD